METQLDYAVALLRSWARQADIDAGKREGVPSDSAAEIRRYEQDVNADPK